MLASDSENIGTIDGHAAVRAGLIGHEVVAHPVRPRREAASAVL